jgi:hypothetical protein
MGRQTRCVKRKPNKLVLAVIAVAHIGVTTLTWRDLRHRQPDQVRGSKKLWQAASGINTTGSVAYWLFGRRKSR